MNLIRRYLCVIAIMLSVTVAASAQSLTPSIQKAIRSGDWSKVESLLRAELRSAPRDPDLLTLLSMALLQQGKFDAALQRALTLIEMFPESYRPRMIAAECHMRMRRTEQAIELFRSARMIAPDSAEPAMALGMILATTSRCDEAITYLEESLFRRPDNTSITLQLVRCYLRIGRASEAAELAARSAELNAGNADVQLAAGEALMAARRTEEAIPHLERALSLGSRSQSCYLLITAALQDKGRTREALDVATKYVGLAPSDPQGWYNVGLLQIEVQQLDSSLKALRKAIMLKPNYPEAHYNLGRVYDGLGFSEDAVQSYRRSAATAGEYAADAYLGIAIIHRKSGNFTEALRAHNQSVALRDTSQVLRVQRLRTCFDADRCAEASEFLDDDVSSFPNSPMLLFEAARCYARTGRRSEAERILLFLDKESPPLARDLRVFMSL